MFRTGNGILTIGIAAATAWGQPREWSDDFTVVATYDSRSLYGPCRGGGPTKYTLVEAMLGEIYTQRAWSGGGYFTFNTRSINVLSPEMGRLDFAMIGWGGLGLGCPGEPPGGETTEPFTSGDVCVYGAVTYTPWQCKYLRVNGWNIQGSDGKPGVANLDDDVDGTTDEWDETPAARPTTINDGYGRVDGTGFQAGLDAAPGVAGVDDDGNGIVDDVGETGWAGSDDGDDTQRQIRLIALKANIEEGRFVYLNFDAGAYWDAFSFWQVIDGATVKLEWANEIQSFRYFQPGIRYNWTVCVAASSCYGAMMWQGSDMANPAETLGPLANSSHTEPADKLVGMGFYVYGGTAKSGTPLPTPVHFHRQVRFAGNGNFSDTFWVVSGNPAQYYPSPSADLDGDRDVDGFDFLTFSNCYNGSNKPPLSACSNGRADLDMDGDVDGFDFLTFSNCYNGSNRKPLAACFPPNLTACGS
jgi:hypothetical protein